jgi:hypothetical protein
MKDGVCSRETLWRREERHREYDSRLQFGWYCQNGLGDTVLTWREQAVKKSVFLRNEPKWIGAGFYVYQLKRQGLMARIVEIKIDKSAIDNSSKNTETAAKTVENTSKLQEKPRHPPG